MLAVPHGAFGGMGFGAQVMFLSETQPGFITLAGILGTNSLVWSPTWRRILRATPDSYKHVPAFMESHQPGNNQDRSVHAAQPTAYHTSAVPPPHILDS